MSKKIEVLQYQKAVESLEAALLYAPHLKDTILPAIDNCKVLIDRYNLEDYRVHNPTKGELGKIKYCLKKVVTTHFKDKLKNGRYFKDECKSLIAKVHYQCDKTIISESLIDSKIQILRKFPNAWTRSGFLENELNSFLNTKLLECFLQQNEDFIRENLI